MAATWTGTIPTFVVERARASKLQTLSDALTAATDHLSTWSPTTTNLTLGTGGTLTARHTRLNNGRVRYRVVATLGTSFSFSGGTPTFTLPVAPHSTYVVNNIIGTAHLHDTGTGVFNGVVDLSSLSGNGVARFLAWGAAASASTVPIQAQFVTSTFPHTWAATDILVAEGEYEPA